VNFGDFGVRTAKANSRFLHGVEEYPDVVFLMVNTSNTHVSEDEDETSKLDDNDLR
jgi:uncharacterized protein YlzI (FlbEa/FlbD family)